MDELTRPAGAPREAAVAEVERLRAEVERLARDNAALRSQVATLDAGAAPAGAAPGARTASSARRWTGRLLMLLLFVLGIAIGAWSVHSFGTEFLRGYRDGRADAADRAAPAAPADR